MNLSLTAQALTSALTNDQIAAMREVKDGADVFAYGMAAALRSVERDHPKLIMICAPMGEYDPVGQLPYFGAILTTAGRKALKQASSK